MKGRHISFSWRRVAVLAMAAFPATATAVVPDWIPVPARTLDDIRGGSSLPAQLQVSLGLARLVAVNGNVLARSEFAFDGLDGVHSASVTSSASLQGSSMIVQIGSANAAMAPFADIGTRGVAGAGMDASRALHAGAAASAAGTSGFILQNSLNGQQIDSLTTINASVNSGALLEAINFHGQLSDALVRAAAPQ